MTADEQILDSEVHLNETAKSSMLNKITNEMGIIKRVDAGFEDGEFPEWFLSEVLARLPVKLVFRCKCVSKHWRSVISDPSFSRFYLSRAPASLSIARCPWTIVPKRMLVDSPKNPFCTHFKPLEDIYSGNLTFHDTCALPLPNSQEAMGDTYYIRGVDNGFVLYSWLHPRRTSFNVLAEYYICNPLTKQWFALPASKYGSRKVGEGFIAQVEAGILTSYKVVLLDCPLWGRNLLEFEIFSSETGEWTEFSVYSKIAFRASSYKTPVVLNNNLHWEDRGLGIIAYDPYNSPDKYRIIKFPAEHSKSENGRMYSSVVAHQGHLKFFQLTPMIQQFGYSGFKIWVLEDYSSDHWYLQHAIRNEDIKVDDRLIRGGEIRELVSFHPYDADTVYLNWGGDNLVSYNIQTRRVEVVGVFQEREINVIILFDRWPCFLLQLPLWPICIPTSLYMGLTSYNHIMKDTSKPKTKSSVKPYVSKTSTLMKATASQLAKQNQPRQMGSVRFQKLLADKNEKSSNNSCGVEIQAAQRQKLEGAHLDKDATIGGSSIPAKLRLTIPRGPDLETTQRAQRTRPNTGKEMQTTTSAVHRFKALPLNRKEFCLKTSDRAMQHTVTLSMTTASCSNSNKELQKCDATSTAECRDETRR